MDNITFKFNPEQWGQDEEYRTLVMKAKFKRVLEEMTQQCDNLGEPNIVTQMSAKELEQNERMYQIGFIDGHELDFENNRDFRARMMDKNIRGIESHDSFISVVLQMLENCTGDGGEIFIASDEAQLLINTLKGFKTQTETVLENAKK